MHTIQERVAQLQQSLPPLLDAFGKTGTFDPGTYFSQWQMFLLRQPIEPLSFSKMQAALAQPITVS
jgi:hypothetical protein